MYKFQKGDRVKLPMNGTSMKDYFEIGVPSHLIKHGNRTLSKKSLDEGAEVVKTIPREGRYIVICKYTSDMDKTVQLGWYEDVLTAIRPQTLRELMTDAE